MSPLAEIRFLCRCLMPDCGHNSEPPSEDALRYADWPRIFEIAGGHLVTPALAGALARSPHWASLPREYRDYLSAVRELNRQRNATLRRELLSVVREMNRLGVEPLLLKGAICLMSQPYEGSEDRVMGDLDLLVPMDAEDAVFRMLQQRGYGTEPDADIYTKHHHAPPLLHPSLPVTIELHRYVVFSRLRGLLPTAEFWAGSLPVRWEDARVRLPNFSDQLLHTFVHAQLQDDTHKCRQLALRPMLEFAGLRVAHGAELDWEAILRKLDARVRFVFAAYLFAARDLFGQPTPERIPIGYPAKWYYAQARLFMDKPSLHRWYSRICRLSARRLARLPARLLTPSWYSMKARAWRRGEPL